MSVITIATEIEFQTVIESSKPSCALFSADWADQCEQILDVLNDLSKNQNILTFMNIRAEELSDIALKYQIEAVPTILFFKDGKIIDRIDGINIKLLIYKCKEISNYNQESLETRLKYLIDKAEIMVFMKGKRNEPRCGFSKQLIDILNETGLIYETFDIFSDEEVRQGLKTFSNWPTYPQVYVKGELIGGLDIIKELLSKNDLITTLKCQKV